MNEDRAYLGHIRDCIRNITDDTQAGRDAFFADRRIQDAVIRNLEVIGEAVKNLSAGLKEDHPAVPWKQIAAMRDVLIHHYFGVKLDMVWQVVAMHLPSLKTEVDRMLGDLQASGHSGPDRR